MDKFTEAAIWAIPFTLVLLFVMKMFVEHTVPFLLFLILMVLLFKL